MPHDGEVSGAGRKDQVPLRSPGTQVRGRNACEEVSREQTVPETHLRGSEDDSGPKKRSCRNEDEKKQEREQDHVSLRFIRIREVQGEQRHEAEDHRDWRNYNEAQNRDAPTFVELSINGVPLRPNELERPDPRDSQQKRDDDEYDLESSQYCGEGRSNVFGDLCNIYADAYREESHQAAPRQLMLETPQVSDTFSVGSSL